MSCLLHVASSRPATVLWRTRQPVVVNLLLAQLGDDIQERITGQFWNVITGVELGYRQRMHKIWKQNGGFNITEQRLADQVKTIKNKAWFTSEELDEIERMATTTETVQEIEVQEMVEEFEETPEAVSLETELSEPVSENEKELVKEIIETRTNLTENRPKLRALRHIERAKIMAEVKRLDKVLDCVETRTITELNDTILACAHIITERLNPEKEDRGVPRHEPEWKVRLQRKEQEIRKDLSKVVESKGRNVEDPMRIRLERMYKIKVKG